MDRLVIVIPAFNEALRITPFLQSIHSTLPSILFHTQVIIVNDGSFDSTHQVVSSFILNKKQFHLISLNENVGKGGAIKIGFDSALKQFNPDLLCFFDADGSISIQEIFKFLPYIPNYDLIIASRSHQNIHTPFYRKIIGFFFRTLIKFLFGFPVRDTQCGFKLFKKKTYCSIRPFLKINHFSFDVEWIAFAHKLNFSIKEIPIIWKHVPQSKINLFSDPFKMLFDLLDIRSRIKKFVVH